MNYLLLSCEMRRDLISLSDKFWKFKVSNKINVHNLHKFTSDTFSMSLKYTLYNRTLECYLKLGELEKKKMQFPLELTPCFLPFSLLSFVSNFSYKGSSVWTKLIDKLRWLTPIDTNMPTVMKACYIQLNFLNYTFLLISSYETN